MELTKGLKIPEAVKTRIKNSVGDFLVESVVSSAVRAKSPVAGEDWPALSPKYKKHKIEEGLPGKANLEFEGDMLDALEYRATEDGIELGFFGDQAWKADGHLKFSGKDNGIPKRRLLPDEGQEFVPAIQRELEKIVADAVAGEMEFDTEDFENIDTEAELYDVLDEYFPGLSRVELRGAVTRTPALARLLEDNNLLGLL